MTRIITALFDTKADADAGAERLRQAGVAAGSVSVHDQNTHRTAGAFSTREDKGLWASIKGVFVPSEDRLVYEEGIRRGGYVVTADVDEDATPTAVAALEDANSVDLDARQAEWRASGWEYEGTADDLSDYDDDIAYGARDTTAASTRYRSYVPRG